MEGEARLGVVYKPADDKLYRGVVEVGGSVTTPAGTRELRVSTRKEPAEIRLLESRSHKSRRLDFIRRRLGIEQIVECGSVGVKCGLLAEGAADLYIHTSPKSSRWDTCAPEAVLVAAGGRLTDLWGVVPLRRDRVDEHARDLRVECGVFRLRIACGLRRVPGHPVHRLNGYLW